MKKIMVVFLMLCIIGSALSSFIWAQTDNTMYSDSIIVYDTDSKYEKVAKLTMRNKVSVKNITINRKYIKRIYKTKHDYVIELIDYNHETN